jgi:hypothetical protein
MPEQAPPEKKAVYQAVQDIFTGKNAAVCRPKAIRKLIVQHNDEELLAQLLQQHSLDDVATATKKLIEEHVFEASTRGRIARSDLERGARSRSDI